MVGAQAFKMVLRIRCKFSLIYLGIKGATAETTASYGFGSLTDWSDNLSSDLRSKKKSKKAIKRRVL